MSRIAAIGIVGVLGVAALGVIGKLADTAGRGADNAARALDSGASAAARSGEGLRSPARGAADGGPVDLLLSTADRAMTAADYYNKYRQLKAAGEGPRDAAYVEMVVNVEEDRHAGAFARLPGYDASLPVPEGYLVLMIAPLRPERSVASGHMFVNGDYRRAMTPGDDDSEPMLLRLLAPSGLDADGPLLIELHAQEDDGRFTGEVSRGEADVSGAELNDWLGRADGGDAPPLTIGYTDAGYLDAWRDNLADLKRSLGGDLPGEVLGVALAEPGRTMFTLSDVGDPASVPVTSVHGGSEVHLYAVMPQ